MHSIIVDPVPTTYIRIKTNILDANGKEMDGTSEGLSVCQYSRVPRANDNAAALTGDLETLEGSI
ncbi:hypothetical protein HW555_005464 [Spodoptera exigua]|uniref:Uncharacterized protein n=1 Tax=Spodoptera exigua TaxID=7107 RepID=A0A835L5G3_SPOEX|nr:hypothetical protein HW555_005464 [Spodoptera exigua]